MTDFQDIKLSEQQFKEIELADIFYRISDLEKLAQSMESEILNDKIGLFSVLPISPDICRFNQIVRITINRTVNEDRSNERLKKIENLKYPPERVKAKLGYNRASFKEQSIFYGGFGNFQGLFENPPRKGDIFTVSYWQQKENTEICYVSIFHDLSVKECNSDFEKDWNHYQEQLSNLDIKTRTALEKLFSLITYFFTRAVDQNKPIEYLFSAHIANKIFNMNYVPKIEALLYPSVPMGYIASNIAIIPEVFDNKFSFLKAEEYIVLQNEMGKNQWICENTGSAINLDNEFLQWNE